MSVLLTLVLGSLSSLIAAIIWVIFIYLYDHRARNKIAYLLEECDSSTRLLLNSVKYTRYMVVLSQVEKLLDLYLKIDENLKPLNFSRRKRKLMKLLIFNMIRNLNIFKNLEVGYDEEEELKSRCIKYQNKYLYDIIIKEDYTENFMLFSLSILQELNQTIGIKRAIQTSLKNKNINNNKFEILMSLIEINSFRNRTYIQYFMNREVLSKKQYENIVNEICN